MSSIDWGNGLVEFGHPEGHPRVRYFENNGVVWYDYEKGIARPGCQAELAPYCGPDWIGAPFRRRIDRWRAAIRACLAKVLPNHPPA